MGRILVDNKSLDNRCAEIFGSIFEKAYLSISIYNDIIHSEVDCQRVKQSETRNFELDVGLDWDGDTIVMRFANGKLVEFSNSEWAHFINVNLDDFGILECLDGKNVN